MQIVVFLFLHFQGGIMNTSLSLSPRVVQLLASSEIKLVSIVLGVFSLLVFLATIFLEQQTLAL